VNWILEERKGEERSYQSMSSGWWVGARGKKFGEKSEISLLSASPEKKSRIAQNFQPNLDYAPDRVPKDPRRPFPPCSPKYTPNNPPRNFKSTHPPIDRNSEHYCAAQVRSTHHQHQLCCKFVTCYMLFLLLRDSFTENSVKKFLIFFEFV
jgi:hypothetical protein